MTRVFRVLRAAYARSPFDGEGAYRYGGRWSSPGTRIAYSSEHQSLAMLEYFVHLDPEDVPDDLLLATADIPDSVSRQTLRAPAPPELGELGDAFVRGGEICVLRVPSALAVSEWNWLVNPLHPDFRLIHVNASEPLSYDVRMFHKRSRRKH